MSVYRNHNTDGAQAVKALAYGLHLAAGRLLQSKTDGASPNEVITLRQAFGVGEWNACRKMWYQGELLDPAAYVFRRGIRPTAPNDPDQPIDPAFPNSGPLAGTVYSRVTLGAGIGDPENPDKLRGLFECLKTHRYDATGNATDYVWSARPEDVAADLVMKRAKLPATRLDWANLYEWGQACRQNRHWDDGSATPKSVTATAGNTGSLAAGNYYARVASEKGADVSAASPFVAVTLNGGGSQNAFTVSWAAVTGNTGYRVYIGTTLGGEDKYFTVVANATSLTITTLAGANTGTPPTIATGALLRMSPRYEAHIAWSQPRSLSDCLNDLCLITNSYWQDSDGRIRFYLFEDTQPSFALNASHIVLDSSSGAKLAPRRRDRLTLENRFTISFGNLDDEYLGFAEESVENDDLQTLLGKTVNAQPLTLRSSGGAVNPTANMTRDQARRVIKLQERFRAGFDLQADVTANIRALSPLPGDIITVDYAPLGWTGGRKRFWVTRATDGSLEDALGEREITLNEAEPLEF